MQVGNSKAMFVFIYYLFFEGDFKKHSVAGTRATILFQGQ